MKKFAWTFDLGGEDISGEADSWDEAKKMMEACGYEGEEMEFTIIERSDEELAAHAREVDAASKRSRTSLQELANANASMFNQMDGLKNQVATLEQRLYTALFDRQVFKKATEDAHGCLLGVKELVLAWNTEQHARIGQAYEEPPFVDILRSWAPGKPVRTRLEAEAV